jgi:hypothetical protein
MPPVLATGVELGYVKNLKSADLVSFFVKPVFEKNNSEEAKIFPSNFSFN